VASIRPNAEHQRPHRISDSEVCLIETEGGWGEARDGGRVSREEREASERIID
jgi:hypothetical protein